MRARHALGGAVLLIAAACSSSPADSSSGPSSGGAVRVSIAPRSFSVAVGDTQRFVGVASDASGGPVSASLTWGANGGAVSGTGLFTAGVTAGAAKVWVAAGAALSDTATGTITPASSPSVDTVFAEGFESGSFSAWDDRGAPANQAILTDAALAHSGTHVLQVTFPLGSDGGWLTKFFMPGYDSIYASYWVRFQAGWQSGTKLLAFYGSRTDNQWSATGKAGVCPNGTDFFSLDVVQERSGNPGPTHFYSYYPGMAQSPPGSGTCYGLDGSAVGAQYTTPLEILPGAWHHVEFWVVLNTPGQSNLSQRFCIDGVLRGQWSGISARTSTILRLNAVTISNSIATGSPQTQLMWVDDLLVTRQRPPGAC